MTGIAVAVGALLDPVDVVSSGVEGVSSMPLDVAAVICAPPVLTATPARPVVVVEPVDVSVVLDVDTDDVAGDAAVVPTFGLAIDELANGD